MTWVLSESFLKAVNGYGLWIGAGLAVVSAICGLASGWAGGVLSSRAERVVAELHLATANARAVAATAQAEAERAKLETAQVSERLALTQERLDTTNKVIPLSEQQLDLIVRRLRAFPLGDTQPVWAAANDHQAQLRLQQLTNAFAERDMHLYPNRATGSLVAPKGEVGEILVHYWSDYRRVVAEGIAEIFRDAGLTANAYVLPPEPQQAERDATRNMVLVGIAARPTPSFTALHD